VIDDDRIVALILWCICVAYTWAWWTQ